MLGAIKEIIIDTWNFLRNFWWSTEDFFEFKVWPYRLEWLIGLTGLLTAFNILLLFHLIFNVDLGCIQ
tara:strand:- start:368 stop:571 length:204 start_codon:yes stop_codon:yes gene_type:complete